MTSIFFCLVPIFLALMYKHLRRLADGQFPSYDLMEIPYFAPFPIHMHLYARHLFS